jgi:hypothetical protein
MVTLAGAVKCWLAVGAVTETLGGVSGPVQAVPLSVNAVGTLLVLLFHEPLKPMPV